MAVVAPFVSVAIQFVEKFTVIKLIDDVFIPHLGPPVKTFATVFTYIVGKDKAWLATSVYKYGEKRKNMNITSEGNDLYVI